MLDAGQKGFSELLTNATCWPALISNLSGENPWSENVIVTASEVRGSDAVPRDPGGGSDEQAVTTNISATAANRFRLRNPGLIQLSLPNTIDLDRKWAGRCDPPIQIQLKLDLLRYQRRQ